MATTTDPQLSADSGGNPATVGGGIIRLNATDGLFLRAEHLNTMEDYALELSTSVGVAAGSGVVYGYRVWLDDTTLKVDAGLAMGPDGRPLRSLNVAELDISTLTAAEDEFFVVEVAPADWVFGQENVYGNLCTDPCSQGGQIHPYQAEGIAIGLHPDTMPGLSAEPNSRKRNWLASEYYEREREQAGPWLVPFASGMPVPGLDTNDFSTPTAPPGGTAVPLAALLKLDSGWVVDVWIARRDIGDPAPRRAWQSRLAMRPWDVFIAQVLQFQAQFKADYLAAQQHPVQQGTADEISNAITALREGLERQRVKAGWLKDGISKLEKAAEDVAEASSPGLHDQGFWELPPAGYLPVPSSTSDPAAYATSLFGTYADVRICRCRADDAVRAVEQAQHLDRIPLDPSLQRDKPRIDVLVPSDLADLKVLYAASYPWVAFVRRPAPACEPVDEVAVYFMNAGEDSPDAVAQAILKGKHPSDDDFVAQLTYPAGTYAVPAPHDIYGRIQATINAVKDHRVVGIGLASAEDRQPLAAARTVLFLLGAPPGGGEAEYGNDLLVGYQDGLAPEEIVIVVGQAQQGGALG
jgi:hypothetical protein